MRRASVKLNYRMVLCIAVLVLLLLTIIFGGLFKSRGSKIADLNSQIETLNKDKDNLSAQIGALDAGESDPAEQHHRNASCG